MIKSVFLFMIIFSCVFLLNFTAFAQEVVLDKQVIVKAQVLEIISQEVKTVPGTDVKTQFQKIKVRILEGEEKDNLIAVENDYLNLKKGEIFYLVHITNSLEGTNLYSVSDPYRLPTVYFFMGLFIFILLLFGGWQGVRGLISLIASLGFIFYLLLPGILNGYSPILISMGVASLIVILGSYITHGFNRTTSAAVIGMVLTIILTGVLAYLAVHFGRLSGMAADEAVYLNFDTRGSIDFAGLLLGGIIIGLLGILYDAAIGQAIAIEELSTVAPNLSKRELYKRGLRIGREHIGALVNTLAIAYVGVSLPLLLLFYTSSLDIGVLINREIFASEIIRTMVGSIGIILVVPLTTLIAVYMLIGRKKLEGERHDSHHH